MNILYVFGFRYSLELWKQTGAIEREFQFIEKLSEIGNVKYTLITYGDLKDVNLINKENISIIPMFSIFKKTNSKALTFIYSLIMPFKIRKNVNNIDLIKTNQLTGSWIAIIFKKVLKKPLFLRTGYDAYIFSVEEKKSYFKKNFFYQLTKTALRNSSLYSVTSQSDFNFINENYSFKKSKLIYRPNWIIKKNNIKHIPERSNNFISVGRLESQKNYKYLIKCLAYNDLTLDILGEGSEKDELISLSKEKKVNINFLKNIGYFELNDLFQNYKFFLIPSTYEGNPKVLLEAMSNGCIPIASNISNHKEIITHGENGFLFSLQDDQSLLNIIKKLKDFDYLNKISKNAYESVVKKNSFEDAVNQEIYDYKKILGIS